MRLSSLFLLCIVLAGCEDNSRCDTQVDLLSEQNGWTVCPAGQNVEVTPLDGQNAAVVVCSCPAEAAR